MPSIVTDRSGSFKFGQAVVLVEERRRQVLELVNKRGFVALTELTKAIDASESTLRRDIEHWHKKGLLRKTHGGAMCVGNGHGLPPLEDRSEAQIEEKRRIAAVAAARIHNGD